MNKNDAAAFLGVSLRSLERYGAEGKITPTIKRTPKGRAADYNEADLVRLKAELAGEIDIPPQGATATPPPLTDRSPQGAASAIVLSRDSPQGVMPTGAVTAIVPSRQSAAAIVAVTPPPNIPTQDATFIAFNREVLTVADAVLVSGFSSGQIRTALKDKTLKGKQISRKWRILRTDLDDWCKGLFE